MTPITWQLVVNTHPDEFHLFQYEDEYPFQPQQGMLLCNVEGIPNVTGPDAGFDNVIRRVLWDGKERRLFCQVQGYRDVTKTVDEVREELPGWNYVTQLANVQETGPEDLLEG